ncbi:hypothetical protein [Demequina sediminicola]|nr:hypothetical protein [Demequina sediminicola]
MNPSDPMPDGIRAERIQALKAALRDRAIEAGYDGEEQLDGITIGMPETH